MLLEYKKLIKDYHVYLDDYDERYVNFCIEKYGIDIYLNKILKYLDCTRYYPDSSMRLIQTIDYPYSKYITIYSKILDYAKDKMFVDEVNNYIENILKIHNHNIEYEKEYPPVVYTKTKSKTKKKDNAKQDSQSKANTKLKEKMQKLNTLAFNIKLAK